MSDGVGNNMKSKEQQGSDSKKCKANEFGREVSRIAVAQMCNSAGFHSFKESALDALADIAIKYLGHLGKIAAFYANLAGRIECNVFDIIRGLEELESSQGFQGAWEPNHCLANSGSGKNIVRYVDSVEEIPFAQPLPRFPVIRNREVIPSFVQIRETPPSKHIPNWLPAFPDAHTYNHSALWRRNPREPHLEKIEFARQRRRAEKSLLGLQQRLVSCGSASEFSGDESKSWTCLQEMEDGIDLTSEIAEDVNGIGHLSVPEVFAPAIEAIKGGDFPTSENDKGKILPRARPLVHFKLETSKTFLGGSMNLNAKMTGIRESVFWVRRDDERDRKHDGERDVKKKRVEYILKHSVDKPEELNQS